MPDDQPVTTEAMPVTRDSQFKVLVFDNAFFKHSASAIDATLIMNVDDIVSLGVNAETGAALIDAKAAGLEVARLRMSPATAFFMLQNLASILMDAGVVSSHDLIAAMTAAAERVDKAAGKG
ncbi:MAG: hypothetical protein ACRYHC_15475 [Janthinobacterium lividum]